MSEPLTDCVRRFTASQLEVRGQWVHLSSAWLALREHSDYPIVVRDLLGESVAAAVLLASTLKFDGTLTLQMQGDGAVRLLVAQCSHDFRVRAVARFDAARVASAANNFAALKGSAQITVTLEAQHSDARYQGIVPADGASLSQCLELYFANSEQLPTAVRLASNAGAVAGLLVQRMPAQGGTTDAAAVVSREQQADSAFAAARAAVAAVDADELLVRDAQALVPRFLPEQDIRLLPAATVSFECRCSPERVSSMLRSLGESEVRDVLAEQGSVTVTCEFCHRPYRFDAVDVSRIFVPAEADAQGSESLN